MIATKKSTIRVAIEEMEPRLVPAGNVTAQFVDPAGFGVPSVLSIVGDNEANEIRVVEDSYRHVRVEGLGSTTVNFSNEPIDLWSEGNVINFAEINLGNGNDVQIYEFTGNQWNHRLAIETGTGDDSVTVLVRGAVGRLSIDTGFGNDSINLDLAAGSLIIDGLMINTGAGADTVFFRAESGGDVPLLLGGPASLILTEQGNDTVQFEGKFSVFGTDLYVDLGKGDDTLIGDSVTSLSFSTIEANGGSGFDTIINPAYFTGNPLFFFEQIDGD